MSNGILGIGISGLAAAQAGLVTTGHNIANASTPGYHRQNIQQSAVQPLLTRGGFIGQGVNVDNVVRKYSDFLETQANTARSQASFFATYHTQMSQIDNVVADTQAGLSPALQEFFQAANTVAANPSNVPSRQSLLSAGQALTAGFSALGARFVEMRAGVNSQVSSTVAEINAHAQEIAKLNGAIIAAQANPSQPPNDLLDQRGVLVGKLNDLIGVSVIPQADGSLNVFMGSGQNLVVGKQAMALSASPSLEDPRRLEVGYVVNGGVTLLNSASLRGGSLGGVIAFRANDLDAAQNALGRVALGLAQTFNDQQRLGQDLNGVLGTDFFTSPATTVIDRASNTGNAVIAAAISDVGALTTSDYRLMRTAAGYDLTRVADGTTTSYAALPQTVDGITISLTSGAAATGDSFLIQPTRHASRAIEMSLTDPAGVAAAAPIRTGAAGGNTGSGTISAGTVNSPPPTSANLQQPVTITFTSATTFDVTGVGTGNPTGVAYTPGADITYNGWTVQLAGTQAAGDVFTVTRNSGGVADGRNALLMAGLQTKNTLAGGTTSFQGAYSQMVSAVGTQTRQVEVSSMAQAQLADQAGQAVQSMSGVNLDEEAANLLRYQQAYQASGKMIQIAATLFQTMLDLGN
jgi:flagellar hook-associated protein 1 FlgK